MSIIEQFIQKRLDSSGGRLQVGTLFTGLNKLPEYQTDRQGSGRKPLNYLSSTFADLFQFVNSSDGKTWVSRVGDEPLPPGAEPARDAAESEEETIVEEAPAIEEEEAVVEEAPAIEEEIIVEEAPAVEEAPVAGEEPAGEELPTLAQRLTDGGMDPETAAKLAPAFENAPNLRAAYNEIRKIFGNADGRTYYHQAKAIIDAQ